MSDCVYTCNGVRFGYGAAPILEGLSMEIQRGSFVGIIGPNGAGKSTLLHLLTGWRRPTAGSIALNGRPLGLCKRGEIARQVAVVPQREDSTFPFSVEQVVLMARHVHQASGFGFETVEDHRIARNALERLDLATLAHRPVSALSGGEFQRVLLARALAQQTPVLLLDEPTASLDLAHQHKVFALLSELNAEGRTIVAVLHDINLAALFCREIAVLHEGRIAHRGSPSEVLSAAVLSHIYNSPLSVIDHSGRPLVVLER